LLGIFLRILIYNLKNFFGKVGSGRAEFTLMLFVGVAIGFTAFDLSGYLLNFFPVTVWTHLYDSLNAMFSGWYLIGEIFYPPSERLKLLFRTILAALLCFPFLSCYLFLRNKVIDENVYLNNFNCFDDVYRFQSGDLKVFSLTDQPVAPLRLNGNLMCILDRFFLLIPDSDNMVWSLGEIEADVQQAEPSVTIFCALGDARIACRLIVVEDRSDPMRVKYLGGGNLTDIKSIIRSNVAKLDGVKECFLRSSQLMTVNKRHQLAYKAMLLMEDGEYTVLGSYLTLNQKSYELLLLTPPEDLDEDLKMNMIRAINNIKVKGFGALNEFELFK
tara:strand:- start:3129 stop:4118 length:990 start_codon:yes stop_codon:yes gene_type:complete